jgi:hypothetical protein
LVTLENSLADANYFLKGLDLPIPLVELEFGLVGVIWYNDRIRCELHFLGTGRYNLYGQFAGGPPFEEEYIDIRRPLSDEILEDILDQ